MDRSEGGAEGDPKVVAAKVLENGGVVLEMDSEESAAWLRVEPAQKAFENHCGGSARIKEPVYQLVVDFVPVMLRDTLAELPTKMEVDNGLPTGAIVKARWIRAPKNWKDGQRFAHAIL
ncbi:hypothetical protein BYT27DRAFT_7295499, partial [Phlegmacium glaucopus]